MKSTYTVTVLGFDQTERIVLASIFGLAARRNPKFVQAAVNSASPDIFLVDTNHPEAIARFKAMNADRSVPSILIGDSDLGTGWPVLKRPLQWTRLFKAFDLAVTLPPMQRPVAPAPSQDFQAGGVTQPLPVSSSAQTQRIVPGSSVHSGIRAATPTPTRPPTAPPQAQPPSAHKPATEPSRTVPGATQRFNPTSTGIFNAPVEPDSVMVVDDSPAVREFMRAKLEPFSFKVDYAGSGEEAIGLTASRQYTCVFLDVIMPGIDGYQVCKMIKARKSVRPTAVVMLTSKSSPFDRIRGTMAGCDAYLTKPVDEEKLLEVISKYLQTSA